METLCEIMHHASLMLLVYKPFVSALRYAGLEKVTEANTYKFNKKSLLLAISSIIVLVVAIAVIASHGIEIK